MALIEFALQHCEDLVVFLCYHNQEPISGAIRTLWLQDIYSGHSKIQIFPFEYDPEELSDSSVSSIKNSRQWSQIIKTLFPNTEVVFSSEKYGQYLADILGIRHIYFDEKRTSYPVSSSQIRRQPLKFWDFIPSVAQPFFVKKIAIVGSESTGKSTLTKNLALHYQTAFVAESARELVGATSECTYEDLINIAFHHANAILQKQNIAKKFLFIDTEIHTTKSYSKFLFDRELITEQWIEKTNQCDLYIFLEPDCVYVQDGTRLDENQRLMLDRFHKEQFQNAAINYISISGNWAERFILASEAIDKAFVI